MRSSLSGDASNSREKFLVAELDDVDAGPARLAGQVHGQLLAGVVEPDPTGQRGGKAAGLGHRAVAPVDRGTRWWCRRSPRRPGAASRRRGGGGGGRSGAWPGRPRSGSGAGAGWSGSMSRAMTSRPAAVGRHRPMRSAATISSWVGAGSGSGKTTRPRRPGLSSSTHSTAASSIQATRPISVEKAKSRRSGRAGQVGGQARSTGESSTAAVGHCSLRRGCVERSSSMSGRGPPATSRSEEGAGAGQAGAEAGADGGAGVVGEDGVPSAARTVGRAALEEQRLGGGEGRPPVGVAGLASPGRAGGMRSRRSSASPARPWHCTGRAAPPLPQPGLGRRLGRQPERGLAGGQVGPEEGGAHPRRAVAPRGPVPGFRRVAGVVGAGRPVGGAVDARRPGAAAVRSASVATAANSGSPVAAATAKRKVAMPALPWA